ncbi:MAG: hypothetical protein K8F91_25460, partial [Candidatus Obscuribacterales bacterium]|nr:hypothetical protein [Candidatus Obscuribacterales bacterium]
DLDEDDTESVKVDKSNATETPLKKDQSSLPESDKTAAATDIDIDRDRDSWRNEAPATDTSNHQNVDSDLGLERISSLPLTPASARSRWESPAANMVTREPSLEAKVVIPERAIAGKFLTVSVLTSDNQPERAVELSFNGATLTTDNNGQAMFMVPEDAIPGKTLHVSLAARPELSPGVIDVLQPLVLSNQEKAPSLDKASRMVTSSKVLILDGHDFEGLSRHNKVQIDTLTEARVVAASPVQLRVALPDDLSAGTHKVTIDNNGAKSNAGSFEYIKAEIATEEKKKDINKIIVTVKGTQNPVHVRLINRTPDVIKISKGDNLIVTTSGGSNNTYSIGVKRLKKGDYKVDARIEM